jgi:hypothetical protein
MYFIMGGPKNSFFHLKLIGKMSFYLNFRAHKGKGRQAAQIQKGSGRKKKNRLSGSRQKRVLP